MTRASKHSTHSRDTDSLRRLLKDVRKQGMATSKRDAPAVRERARRRVRVAGHAVPTEGSPRSELRSPTSPFAKSGSRQGVGS